LRIRVVHRLLTLGKGQAWIHATVGECRHENYLSSQAPYISLFGLSDAPGGTGSPRLIVKVLSIYNAYNMIMSAVKRVPVSETVWKKLGEMKGAGQTYDDLLEEMIERVKKARLEEDVKMWESCPDSEYVSLSEIKD